MAETILDKLDRDHGSATGPGGARRYVASLIVLGGATRAQVAAALAKRFGIQPPTSRSVTTWINQDAKLIAMLRELEEIKREAKGDVDISDLPEPTDPAEASRILYDLCVACPPFGTLVSRDDADGEDDVAAVLAAGHETDEAFEADCIARLDDYDPHAVEAA